LPSERLSSADVSFFYLESRTTPQHVGGLAVFRPPADGLDYDRLITLLEERISLAPRYRQKMRAVPGHIANPVWVDDPNFDITYHVRRTGLPRPGGDAELLEFCARIQSRLLDRSRPLWEMYLVEGLQDHRVAIVTKTHHSMVDGRSTVDIAQVLLDESVQPRRTVETLWMPAPEPSSAVLLGGALLGVARRPAAVLDTMRLGMNDVRATSKWVQAVAGSALSAGAALVHRAPASPLSATLGEQRRVAIARTRLDDYRTVRRAHDATVNDVVLASVAGALRSWLLQRGESIAPMASIRTLVPVSVHDPAAESMAVGATDAPAHGPSDVTGLLVDLPIGEPDAVRRLRHVRETMAAHRRSGRAVNADVLVELSGFAPPTLHALGARAAHGLTRRMFSLVVTNVPGPQSPLYAAGARMIEMFPVLPLAPGHAVSIGLTSYDGGVFFGINADRDAVPDVAALAGCIEDSLAELVELSPPDHDPPTRGAPARATRRRPSARSATTPSRDTRSTTEPSG
jgi:WS/DGAT/MGAT family acyltransferase